VSPSSPPDEDLTRHYAPGDLATAVLTAIAKTGKDPSRLTPEDLVPMDEFHVRGREATLEFARAADLRAGQRVHGEKLAGCSKRSRCEAAPNGAGRREGSSCEAAPQGRSRGVFPVR